MIACIIPCRGGSKGIPRKNLHRIGGLSLVARSVLHAKAAASVDEVWVSTDDQAIAEEAREAGAAIYWRSSRTATDTATSESAILEWLEHNFYPLSISRNQAMGARWAGARPDPEAIVFLQATSPLRSPVDIDNAVETFRSTHADSVFSARRIEGYVWRHDGRLCPMYRSRQRRQEEPVEWWEENGSIYVFRSELIRREKRRLGGHIVPYQMHALRSYQIDEPPDIELVESIHQLHETGLLDLPDASRESASVLERHCL